MYMIAGSGEACFKEVTKVNSPNGPDVVIGLLKCLHIFIDFIDPTYEKKKSEYIYLCVRIPSISGLEQTNDDEYP